jgi:hypothetical protein
MTVVAVVVMLLPQHWRFVAGLVALVAALLDVFCPIIEMLAVLLDPRTWRDRKPSERAIKEFAARYPARPDATPNSGKQPDSNLIADSHATGFSQASASRRR